MPLSQNQFPLIHAFAKAILRTISLLLSIVALIFLIYISIRFSKNFAVAYAAVKLSHPLGSTKLILTQVLFAFFLDTAEIILLTERRHAIPPFPPLLLFILELGTLGLLAGGCVTTGLADLTEEQRSAPGYKYPADPWRMEVLWMQVALGYY